MPDRDAHNDIGGRFTKKAFSRCTAAFLYVASFLAVPSLSSQLPRPIQAIRRWTGPTPLFLALVRARGGRCFHNSAPPPRGVAPVPFDPCWKAGRKAHKRRR